jgi:exopolyphosphatase/guanosine-5'-triphosphate,3'-diphosphate pyrophosphatase
MKLGAIRLTERFFADGVVSARQVRRCSAHVAATLTAVADELEEGQRHEVAVGSSGTISSIASMIAAGRGDDVGDLNGFTFTADELAALVSRLVELSAEDRRRVPGLDSRRADIIVGGALLLEGAFETFDIDEMTVSGYALREGVLFDRMAADREQSARRLTDLRRSNALRLAHQLDPDAAHAETAASLAVSLFDQTTELHGLGRDARELLELAAIVHNVGLFISHSAHHKHTYYVVRHSEQLTGFTERERELLALIARYHRRSHPKPRHEEFAALPEADQDMVRALAGMLRIAIGLDRSHRGLVDGIEVAFGSKDDPLVITPTSGEGLDLSLEVFSAQERAHLLAEALGREVVITDPTGG